MSEKKIVVPEGVLCDECDHHLLLRRQYRLRTDPRTGYTRVLRGTRNHKAGTQAQVSLSHDILGRKPGFVIDHINGNPLDNRRANLRHCTQAQNMLNRKTQKSKTGNKGVYKTPYGRYTATVWFEGKSYSSNHDTLDAAIAARRERQEYFHGEFARKA